jgi:hypothetical protein
MPGQHLNMRFGISFGILDMPLGLEWHIVFSVLICLDVIKDTF